MLDKKDAQWWLLEAQQHPEAIPELIHILAERLAFMDRQNEELRGELITLRRKQPAEATGADMATLRQRIHELEGAVRRGGSQRQIIVLQPGQIVVNSSFDDVIKNGPGRVITAGSSLIVADSTARLLAITADSRVFSVALNDLPVPTASAGSVIENPPRLTVLIDQAVFERCRYLTLLSKRGYVYSVLAGTVNRLATRGEPLIRNLIPDDPIIAAFASNNTDLIVVSRQARWTRFPERSIAPTGSPALEVPKGDALLGLALIEADRQALFLTTSGQVFVRQAADLPARATPGKSAGLLCRGQTLLGVATGTNSSDLFVLTRQGKLIVSRVDSLPYRAQGEDGAPLPGLAADDNIAAFVVR